MGRRSCSTSACASGRGKEGLVYVKLAHGVENPIPGLGGEVIKRSPLGLRKCCNFKVRGSGGRGRVGILFWRAPAGLGIHPHPGDARGARPSMTVKRPGALE